MQVLLSGVVKLQESCIQDGFFDIEVVTLTGPILFLVVADYVAFVDVGNIRGDRCAWAGVSRNQSSLRIDLTPPLMQIAWRFLRPISEDRRQGPGLLDGASSFKGLAHFF
jgi:hypothetical protein